MSQIVVFHSAFNPDAYRLYDVAPGTAIAEWLDSTGHREQLYKQPIVIHLNGVEICEEDYEHVLKCSDHVMLIALPQWQSIAAYIVDNWIYIAYYAAAALYVSSIEPALPNAVDTAEGSPTYTISAQGNKARLGQPKPVLYGTMRTYPDLSSRPYSEYLAGDQFLYQLFEVTVGIADVDMSTARFEDTPLSNFSAVEYNVLPPGTSPALYPVEVITSSEVTGIEIADVATSEYVANPVSTSITQVAFDIVAPAGIYEQDKQTGELKSHHVQIRLEAQLIDDSDAVIGPWLLLDTVTLQSASRDALRNTYRYSVDEGRYQCRVSRVNASSDIVRISDNVQWTQLKSYVADDITETNTTRIELVVRSSDQLGNKALSKFNVVSARWLKIWNPDSGWSSEFPTNSPVWAFCDICRNDYGGKRSDAYLNLAELRLLADQYSNDNIEFNAVFDTKNDVWSALEHVATASFSTRIDQLGVYTLVRDTLATHSVAAFTMRNIIRGSFKIDDAGVLEETANAVRVWFYDKDQDYRNVSMLCALDGSPADNVRDVKLFGVTSSDHAHRLGMYLVAQNRYRRRYIEFDTGAEGRLIRFGDQVKVSHYLLGEIGINQVSGEVVNFNSVDEIELNELLPDYSDPWIYLRGKNGQPLGPYAVQKIGRSKVKILEAFAHSELSFEAGYERTHFAIGEGDSFLADVKITEITYIGNQQIKVKGFVDNPIVYSISDGIPIPPVTNLPAPKSLAPTVSNLYADVRGTIDAPEVHLSWAGENADKYLIHFSSDNGVTFTQAGIGISYESRFIYRPPLGNIIFRVAGLNIFRGEWESIVIDTTYAGHTAPLPPENLQLRSSFVGTTCEIDWDGEYQSYRVEIIDNNNSNTFFDVATDDHYNFSYLKARENGIGRDFTIHVFSISANSLLSESSAILSVSNPPPAILNNIVVSSFTSRASINFDYPTDEDVAGVSVWLSTDNNFSPSNSNLLIDSSSDPVLSVPIDSDQAYVIIAAADVWGNDDLNYSGQYTISNTSFFAQLQTLDLASPLSEFGSISDEINEIQDSITTLSGGQGGLADLSEQVNDLSASINQNTASIASTNQAFANADAALAQQITALDSDIDQNTASIAATNQAFANADSVLAQQMTVLSTTLDDHSTSINETSASVDGIYAVRSVYIDNNGYLTGYALTSELVNGGTVSTLAFHADNFYVGKEGYSNIGVFIVDTVEQRIGINGALVVTGTITADALDVDNLSAISANMGTITTGELKTTPVPTAARVEISSTTDYPLWIGQGAEKSVANALVYYDRINNNFVVKQHGASGDVIFSTGNGIDLSSLNLGALAQIDNFNSANIQNFFSSAAIPDALIGNLNVSKIIGNTANFVEANLGNAVIQTAMIANQAVTFPVTYSASSTHVITTGWTGVAAVTFNNPSGAPIHLSFVAIFSADCSQGFGSAIVNMRIAAITGGSTTYPINFGEVSRLAGTNFQRVSVALDWTVYPTAGIPTTYEFQSLGGGTNVIVRNFTHRSLIGLETKDN